MCQRIFTLLFVFLTASATTFGQRAWAGAIDVTLPPYGAKGDGSTDDTDALNRALKTGDTIYLPAAQVCYRTSAALLMTTSGQLMYGDGRTRSKICPVSSKFSGGVIYFKAPEVGPQLRDLGIVFSQPDTKSRSSMTRYEPAILARNVPRFQLHDVRISQAWVGIDMTENSGGALIDDLEISAFNAGVLIDGSLDSVRLENVHSWTFDLTPNQQVAFFDSGAITFDIGRCDDCKITGGFSMAGTAMRFFRGLTGSAFGSISDFAFDTNNGIDMSAGTFDISNVYFTLNPNAAVQAICMSGGSLNISSFWLLAGSTTTPMVSVFSADKVGTTSLNMSNGKVTLGRQDAAFLMTQNMGGQGRIGLNNIFIDATPNVPHKTPVILIDESFRLQAIGNQISDKGTGAGTFMQISHDDWHRVAFNASVGWANKFPTPGLGVYQSN